MTNTSLAIRPMQTRAFNAGEAFNLCVIGLMAFLTVVDLFATQALLPSLAQKYTATPAQIGVAVNASTIGMAISGIAVALFSSRINRRWGVVISLVVLAAPTTLLAHAPDLTTFFALRLAQGLCMCAAFSLTLAHLGERCSASASPAAFAAYVTGNVASNLIGRLIAVGLVDTFGLEANFYAFAALNLAGAALAWTAISRAPAKPHLAAQMMTTSPLAGVSAHLHNANLRIAFAIGFLILFAFIGTFTYVNFVLVREPFALSMMSRGLVYFVFLPAIFTTPLAGRIVTRLGARKSLWLGFGVALIGLPLLVSPSLIAVLAGMILVGIGTFFAQGIATGFVSRAATIDRGAASGLYLASYFLGGITGAAVLGGVFERGGWTACVLGIGVALTLGCALAAALRERPTSSP